MCIEIKYNGNYYSGLHEFIAAIGKHNFVLHSAYKGMDLSDDTCLCPADYEAIAQKLGCIVSTDGCMLYELTHPAGLK